MKSRFSTIPNVPVTRTPDGQWQVTCTGCDHNITRLYRATADVNAIEHLASHTPRDRRWRGDDE